MAEIPDPFHAGELAVQCRMGVGREAAANAALLRDEPDESTLRNVSRADIVVITSRLDGELRVDLCGGPTGFATFVERSTVRFRCDHRLPPALVEAMASDGSVGGLTLGFAARQRARVNGHGRLIDDATFEISVDEVFFNCTKYIATRSRAGSQDMPVPDGDIASRVEAADMFFIGSHHPDTGLDASHRGGNAGFLSFDGDVLHWTEYDGNAMYQTMGNLALHPEVAVLVPDLVTGSEIRFHGAARIDFGESVSVTVDVDSVSQEPSAMRGRWHVEKQSPHNPEVRSSHGEVA
jgi:uncharacterized protein